MPIFGDVRVGVYGLLAHSQILGQKGKSWERLSGRCSISVMGEGDKLVKFLKRYQPLLSLTVISEIFLGAPEKENGSMRAANYCILAQPC